MTRKNYVAWACDQCTAACTFEAMEWCARRRDPHAECGYEREQPLALDQYGHPSQTGSFEFVQLRTVREN